MNPFGRLWLKRVVQHFSMKGGSVYDESLKGVCQSAEGGGLLPSLRWSYDSRAGARTCLVRMALRQLRRTNRSSDHRPSSGRLRASRRRESLCQPWKAPVELTRIPAGRGGALSPSLAEAGPAFPSASRQEDFIDWYRSAGSGFGMWHVDGARSHVRKTVLARSCLLAAPY